MYNEIDLDKIEINAEPPEEEPARQYYFIAKCRKYVKEESERLGRPRLRKALWNSGGCGL